jgi:hypothetical protein
MPSKPLNVSCSGANLQEVLVRVEASRLFASGPPQSLSVDDQEQPATSDWIARWVSRCRRELFASWREGHDPFISYSVGRVVKAVCGAAQYDKVKVLACLESWPCELASFGAIHRTWSARSDFPGPGFGDLHFPLGWACAFRGAGHERLVSRRWLEFGPWRLMRGGHDTSFVQFHSLDADADTAFLQARAGHERMGISDVGGFIQSGYVYTFPLDGVYCPQEKRLRVLVHGRTVSQLEMLDACAARLYQVLGPQRPVESIAYVFADEAEAAAHLHELWLRELECWTIVNGQEVRIDITYQPPPKVEPEWGE